MTTNTKMKLEKDLTELRAVLDRMSVASADGMTLREAWDVYRGVMGLWRAHDKLTFRIERD